MSVKEVEEARGATLLSAPPAAASPVATSGGDNNGKGSCCGGGGSSWSRTRERTTRSKSDTSGSSCCFCCCCCWLLLNFGLLFLLLLLVLLLLLLLLISRLLSGTHHIAYFLVHSRASSLYFSRSVLYILAISGTSGSSGLGSHSREQIDNNTVEERERCERNILLKSTNQHANSANIFATLTFRYS